MQDSKSQTLAETLTSWLRQGVPGWDDLVEADSQQAWHVTNSLAHALAGRELLYLSGKVNWRGERLRVDIVAFTAEFIVSLTRDSGNNDNCDSWVKPRRNLRFIEVLQTPDVLPGNTGVRQSDPSYKLFYGEYPLWLPVIGGGAEGLAAFAPSLWDDLTR